MNVELLDLGLAALGLVLAALVACILAVRLLNGGISIEFERTPKSTKWKFTLS